ncbi:MAG: NADPH-dependent F420 reductase [Anaerolineaceae bacterium]|nr:NADPH-dependent F420 reductase [Anaerolineaceae bacterium]
MENKTIAIIGGTGNEGKGLAYRWAKSGMSVIIGSRTLEKAQKAVEEIAQMSKEKAFSLSAMENMEAAASADIIVLTVPYKVHATMIQTIAPHCIGKIVVDVTVPLNPPKVTKVYVPDAGSAAQEAQIILGDEVSVVAAFQNVSFEHLLSDNEINCDVLVSGKGKISRSVVIQLVELAGMIGWDAGPIENSVVVEGLTSILIGINKENGVKSSGIRISGIPGKSVL